MMKLVKRSWTSKTKGGSCNSLMKREIKFKYASQLYNVIHTFNGLIWFFVETGQNGLLGKLPQAKLLQDKTTRAT
jgi:hypothetical protein